MILQGVLQKARMVQFHIWEQYTTFLTKLHAALLKAAGKVQGLDAAVAFISPGLMPRPAHNLL